VTVSNTIDIRATTRESRPVASARRRLAAPLGVGLLGLVISLVGINVPSVWYDESATIISATRSWDQLWAMVGTVDAVHALYYSAMHLVFDLVGYSPLALRVPSAIAVGVAAALTVVLGRVLDRPRLGAIAGIVFCLLPRTTWMGTEGRSYAATAAMAVLVTILLVLASRSTRRVLWVLYAVAVVVSVLLFVYLAFVIAAHALTMAVWFASSRSRAWPPVARWVRWAGLATLVVVPFALAVIAQSGQLHWLDRPDGGTLRRVLVGQWFYTSVPFAVVGWLLIAAGAVVLLRHARGLSVASVVLPALVLPTLALLAVSLTVTPIYSPRYLSMCLPFVALVIGAAIDRLRLLPVTVVALAVLASLALPQIDAQRQPEAKENTSWAAVADLIADSRASDGPDSSTAIVYGNVARHPIASTRVIAYSYPEAFEGTVDVTLGTPAAETGALWETRIPLAEGLPRLVGADVVYLVTSTTRDRRPETTETLADAGWHVTEEWNLTEVNVLRYER
jgi:mannosyltransferase